MKSLIITSIANNDNEVLRVFAQNLPEDFNFIVIGDQKSPKNFHLNNCKFFGIEQQQKLGFQLLKQLPYNHYARKNIGYLIAIKERSGQIYETDDDNIPYQNFFNNRDFNQSKNILENKKWLNIYAYFTNETVWARGFPLELIKQAQSSDFKNLSHKKVFTPILQGLADENPDVDAIYRLTSKLPLYFDKNKAISLLNTYSPFNSQNTIWHKKAFPLLYIPAFVPFRMCDIYRSFIAQRICFEYGWGINFFSPSVYQKRNEHNLLNDFKDEIEGYENNYAFVAHLKQLKLHPQTNQIFTNLLICYQSLVANNFIKNQQEIAVLKLWIKDYKSLAE